MFVLVVIFAAGCIYYPATVISARWQTPQIINAALQSDAIQLRLDEFGERRLDILLQVEDPAFCRHKGIDLKSPGAGMTTITQGLVKIHYFDRFQQGIAKIKQTLIARFALDPLVSKSDQLLLFINEVYLGAWQGTQVHGFAQAAHVYFDKSFPELAEEEYLALVAMIAGPNGFHLKGNPEMNAERVRRIRRLLAGYCQPQGWMDWRLEGCR
jgi:membrane carboxypeptidase/penicillin-binding protein